METKGRVPFVPYGSRFVAIIPERFVRVSSLQAENRTIGRVVCTFSRRFSTNVVVLVVAGARSCQYRIPALFPIESFQVFRNSRVVRGGRSSLHRERKLKSGRSSRRWVGEKAKRRRRKRNEKKRSCTERKLAEWPGPSPASFSVGSERQHSLCFLPFSLSLSLLLSSFWQRRLGFREVRGYHRMARSPEKLAERFSSRGNTLENVAKPRNGTRQVVDFRLDKLLGDKLPRYRINLSCFPAKLSWIFYSWNICASNEPTFKYRKPDS